MKVIVAFLWQLQLFHKKSSSFPRKATTFFVKKLQLPQESYYHFHNKKTIFAIESITQQIMKMTRAEPTISISDENLIMIVVVIVTVIIIVFILVMIRDYRLYLGNHWKKKYSFTDFVKHEQFYIYILLFFLLLVGLELLLQNEY